MVDLPTVNPDTTVTVLSDNQDGTWSYGFNTPSGQKVQDISLNPQDLTKAVADSTDKNHPRIIHLLGFPSLSQGPGKGDVAETLVPALNKGAVGMVPGIVADLPNALVHAVGEIPFSILKWAAGGGEGSLAKATKQRYITSSKPFLGVDYTTKKVEQGAKAASQYLTGDFKNTAAFDYIPDSVIDFVDKHVLDIDLTPMQNTRGRKVLAMIGEMAGAAMMEGSVITAAANKLATFTGDLTTKLVANVLGDLQSRKPLRSVALETAAGGMAGAGMVYGPEMLPEGTPKWLKDASVAGFGVLAPVAGIGTASATFNLIKAAPILKGATNFAKGFGQMFTASGIEQAAANAIQMTGKADNSGIVGIREQLLLAQSLGREMDPNTRLSYTLPQMARSEANLLQAEFKLAINNNRLEGSEKIYSSVSDSQLTRVEFQDKINDLFTYADFQEGQMAKVFGDSDVAADVYRLHSNQMLNRADTIKESINNILFKTDLGGEPSPGPDQRYLVENDYVDNQASGYIYAENRRRALIEGRPLSVGQDSLAPVQEALNNLSGKFEAASEASINSAMERIQSIREAIPVGASRENKADFDIWIRKEIEASYAEIDGLENIIWGAIQGIEVPKTKPEIVKNSAGEDEPAGPALMLGDQTVSQYFADRVKAIEAGTSENQNKYLFKLAGRRALIEKELTDNPDSPSSKKLTKAKENIVRIEDQRQDTIANLEELSKKSGNIKPPESLLEFLSRRGGLIDTGGELKTMGVHQWHQKKNLGFGNNQLVPVGRNNNKNGIPPRSLGEALELANDFGYIRTTGYDEGVQRVGEQDLLDLITEEMGGNKVFSEEDTNTAIASGTNVFDENIRFMESLAGELNIDIGPGSLNPATGRDWTLDDLQNVQRDFESQANPLNQTLNDLDARFNEQEQARMAAENSILAKNTAGVSDKDGTVDLLRPDEIKDNGELGVRLDGGIQIGRSAKEVQNILSSLKKSYRLEEGKRGSDSDKLAAIRQLMGELDQVIDQNFPNLNQDMLNSSREVTKTKNRLFAGALGNIMKKGFDGELKVETPAIEGQILPLGNLGKGVDAQTSLTALNKLQSAMTSVTVNDVGGPFIRNLETNEISINPEANWVEISKNPPKPFKQTTIPRGPEGTYNRDLGLSVEEGTPINPSTIKTVEGILWRRFTNLTGKTGPDFNSKAALKFIDDNSDAIKWLEKATGERSGFGDLAAVETKANALNGLAEGKLDNLIKQMAEANSFDETFTVDSFRDLSSSLTDRTKNLSSAQVFLEADPHKVAQLFLTKIGKSSNPRQELNEILKVLESGRLEDGSNPAFKGFQTVIAEGIFNRSLTGPDGEGPLAAVAKRLLESTNTTIKFLDGKKLRENVDNPNMLEVITTLFGDHAPDLFRKFAVGASEVPLQPSNATASSKPLAGTKVADEAIASMGRMAGLRAASAFPSLLNPLMAAGMGRRLAVGVARELKGKGMERHVVEALIDPNYGLSLMKRFSEMSKPEKESWQKRMVKWAHSDLLREPFQNMKARGFTLPGAAVEVIKQAPAAQELIPEDTEEVSALPRPSRGPKIAATNVIKPIAAGSSMNGTLMAKLIPDLQGGMPSGTGSGPTAQGTAERGRDTFGATDPVFANKGGLVSLCGPGKPRQMVS